MQDETPAEGTPPEEPAAGDATPGAGGESVTPGGYEYTVVGDDEPAGGGPSWRRVHPGLLLALAAVVPAVVVGVLVWVFASGSGGGGDRTSIDVSNVVSAFSQGQADVVSTRYEGRLAPGYPDSIPSYPGARLVSSVLQVRGDDAAYLVVYDTPDQRQKVASYYGDKLSADPWQIEAGQDGRDVTAHRFSRIDDPNVSGVVVASESNENELTTIVVSVQVTSGAKDLAKSSFSPPASKTLPDGFPDSVPQYPEATLIETAFQKASSGDSYAVSFLTKDDISKVLDYYRGQFQGGGLTVQDGDASQSSLKGAKAIDFTDSKSQLSGEVTAGTFLEDERYTRIDLQVSATKAQ